MSGAACALLLAAACASVPAAPDASMNAARMAISNAERADASHYAGAELGEARQKLALADGAVRDEDMVLADRLAQEARVEAELAYARTQATKAAAVNEEMGRSTEAMMEEMERAGAQR
jgi:hypothetical protein